MRKHTITFNLGLYYLTVSYLCKSIKEAVEMAKNEFNLNNYTLIKCSIKTINNER